MTAALIRSQSIVLAKARPAAPWRRAQRGIARHRLQSASAKSSIVAGLDQRAGLAVADQAGRAGRGGGDDRQRAGHRFQRDVAERLGDRRVEEHVGRWRARRRGRSPVSWPVKMASGRRSSNQARAGPVADHQHLELRTLRARRASIASANTSRPFSITSRPRKATTTSSSAMPCARAPFACRGARD